MSGDKTSDGEMKVDVSTHRPDLAGGSAMDEPGALPPGERSDAESTSAPGGAPYSAWITLIGYLIAVEVAEVLLAFRYPVLGMGVHIVLLVLLPVHAAFAPRRYAPLYAALVFAPLLRVMSLALPLAGWSMVYWYLATSVPLFAGLVVAARALSLTRAELGLRVGNPAVQLSIALIGVPLGICEYEIMRPTPLIADLRLQSIVIPALILLVSTGFLEELLFRGVLQQVALRSVGSWGLVYVSGIFAVLHIGHLSLLDIVFVFFVGLGFAWLVQRTGSLLGVSLAHGLTNICVFLIIPLVVPGAPASPLGG
jgi:membrane protease YdiL (CAAX protease family)